MLLPLRHAVHALAEIEDEVGAAAGAKPLHVVFDGNLADLMPHRPEDVGDGVDRLEHPGDVF